MSNESKSVPDRQLRETDNLPQTSLQRIEITAISPPDLAQLLSNAFRQQITEDQILQVAQEGNLL